MSSELARLREMHGKICEGCGSSWHIDDLREQPGALSCCPERKIVDARDVWRRANEAEREIERLRDIVPRDKMMQMMFSPRSSPAGMSKRMSRIEGLIEHLLEDWSTYRVEMMRDIRQPVPR